MVGRIVGRTSLCGRPDRKIAGAATTALSFRALDSWRLGFRRLSGVLYAVDGGVLDSRFRPQSLAKALSLAWTLCTGRRDFRQKLYRPESGICAVRGGTRLSNHD